MSNSVTSSEAAAAVAERREEWLEILANLVSIPSENPPGDTTEIAAYMKELLEEHRIDFEVIAPQSEMPNILASFEGEQGSDPHLVFNGHLDTFPMSGGDRWDTDPFGAEIVDGKMYGRGVADMHAGFVASLAAFLYLFENKDTLEGTVTLAAVSDEETGGKWGAEYLVDNHPEYNGDAVLNGEPSTNRVIRFGERGPIWLEIAVRGKAGHISTLSEKQSAIDILAEIVVDINESDALTERIEVPEKVRKAILDAKPDMDAEIGEGASERLLEPDVNVGTIEGGQKPNLIAEHASAMVDVRLPVGNETQLAREWVEEIVEPYPGDVTVTPKMFQEPTYSDYDHPLFQYLQQSAADARDGETPSFSCALGGTDCRFYRAKGVPCAVYGPTPHNIGAENEYVYVDDFMEVVQAQTGAAVAYLNDPTGESL